MVSKYKWHLVFIGAWVLVFVSGYYAYTHEDDIRNLDTFKYVPYCVLSWVLMITSLKRTQAL
jgi:hypothetical protein